MVVLATSVYMCVEKRQCKEEVSRLTHDAKSHNKSYVRPLLRVGLSHALCE